jgi:hypothetical protein
MRLPRSSQVHPIEPGFLSPAATIWHKAVDHRFIDPELCRMDVALIAHLSGLLAEQIAKLKPNPQGAIQCIFRITGRAGN